MQIRKVLMNALAAFCFTLGSAQATENSPQPAGVNHAAPYSAELFAKLPLINGPKLSPGGQRILFSTQTGGNTYVAFRGVTDSKLHTVPLQEKLDLNWYRWAGNNRILKYDPRFFSRSGLRRWRSTVVGDDEFDLDTVSPIAQAQRLTRPVLVAQGMEDTVVPPQQAKAYVDALQSAGKYHEYVSYENEGHGFDDPANLAD